MIRGFKSWTIAAALILASSFGARHFIGPGWWWPFESRHEAFLLACEQTFKQRLKSPSSYRRTSATVYTDQDVTLGEFTGLDYPEKTAFAKATPDVMSEIERLLPVFEKTPRKANIAFINYDASNSYGAILGGIFKCHQAEEPALNATSVAIFGPMVDGFTSIEWTRYQLWASTETLK